jgi:hypothetical protein
MAMADVSSEKWQLNLYFFFQSSDTELRHAQAEFDRQLEITRLMLDGLNNSHVCLMEEFNITKRFQFFCRIIMYVV